MHQQEWIARCAARLRTQWPRVPQAQLNELAEELRVRALRALDEPESAAVGWLNLGIPTDVVAARSRDEHA
jgi:hypothetical protein